ncbi:MAG: hypothetical protein ABFS42_10215 [Candidatus Krumholzibacteriota bacterium]
MKQVTVNITKGTAAACWSTVGALFCVSLLLLQVFAGCSSSTDPEEGDKPAPTIDFFPVGKGQSLKLDETMDFAVSKTGDGVLSVNWYRGGLPVSQDTSYTYVPEQVGRDTLRVGALVGAVRDTYYWVLTVEEEASVVPPEVEGIRVLPGPDPADVELWWTRVTDANFPLVEYLVAISYTGPITEANWDQATILDRIVPVPDQIFYTQIYTEAQDGMRPGETAWFAVRVVDDKQQLSPLTSSFLHDITWPWYLGGYVYDDVGLPLLGVILDSSEGGYSSNTDADGYFLFDQPFRNIDAIRIGTNSPSWYNFVTDPISVDQDTTFTDITLITRYVLDETCYGSDFLEYLRDVTRTRDAGGPPDDSRLMTWDQYPVSVFIPAGLNDAGIDMEECCRLAMAFWDSTMSFDAAGLGITETDYFVRTTDEAAADIVFVFDDQPALKYGETSLLLPDGLDDHLGSAFPEKMQIYINTTDALWNSSLIQGVALHEFGHSLGIYSHPIQCTNTDYLMLLSPGGLGAMDRADPVHLDERRAVRTIRNLPLGVQMSDFTAGLIQFR